MAKSKQFQARGAKNRSIGTYGERQSTRKNVSHIESNSAVNGKRAGAQVQKNSPKPTPKNKMQSQKALYFVGGVKKFQDISTLGLTDAPRFVFAGRSNVGKSSLLNTLVGERIARVSVEPGRTQEMNWFAWRNVYLVDLPGYGFAKVAKTLRDEWGREITTFLRKDPHISAVFSLVDSRHGFLDHDLQLLQFLKESQIPFTVVFTKFDKYKSNNQKAQAKRMLEKQCEKLGVADFLFTSSQDRSSLTPLKLAIIESAKQTSKPTNPSIGV